MLDLATDKRSSLFWSSVGNGGKGFATSDSGRRFAPLQVQRKRRRRRKSANGSKELLEIGRGRIGGQRKAESAAAGPMDRPRSGADGIKRFYFVVDSPGRIS
jgi:hypothetical protein